MFAADTAFKYLPEGAENADAKAIFEKTARVFREADFSMLNLENIFGSPEDYEPLVKSGPNLISSERYLQYIDVLRPTVLGLANNHARDYGDQALYDTMAFCQKNGYLTVGAGRTLDEAYIPLVMEKDGIKVSILAVAENEPGYAEEDHGGTVEKARARIPEILELQQMQIPKAR